MWVCVYCAERVTSNRIGSMCLCVCVSACEPLLCGLCHIKSNRFNVRVCVCACVSVCEPLLCGKGHIKLNWFNVSLCVPVCLYALYPLIYWFTTVCANVSTDYYKMTFHWCWLAGFIDVYWQEFVIWWTIEMSLQTATHCKHCKTLHYIDMGWLRSVGSIKI